MTNNIYIFTDSTADIPQEWTQKEKNFDILPLSVGIGEDQYDFVNTFVDIKTFYERISAGEKCSTSMINEYYAKEKMKAVLDKGMDIIYIACSSALSGSYEGGVRVSKELSAEYPNRKIITIDSKTASVAGAQIVYYALKWREEGKNYDELVANITNHTNYCGGYFTVGDIMHCAKMGRVTKSQAFIANILKLYPVIYLNQLGQLVPIAKVITRKKLLNGLLSKFDEKALSIEQQKIILIGHAECPEDAEYLKKSLYAKYGNDINIVVTDLYYIIGAHGGRGTIVLSFACKDKLEPNDANVKHLIGV